MKKINKLRSEDSKMQKYSDEDIVFVIQKEYEKWQSMYYWTCSKCSNDYKYDEIKTEGYTECFLCKKCGCNLNINYNKINYKNYVGGVSIGFHSIWLNELDRRYNRKIKKYCYGNKDIFGDLKLTYFKSIMEYVSSRQACFNTFLWRSIHNKSIDIERRISSFKNTPNIVCNICGQYVGKISPDHLMNVSDKYKDGISEEFMGHGKFVDHLKEMFKDSIEDLPPRKVKTFLRRKCISEYQNLFPNSILEGKSISLNMNIGGEDDGGDYCLMDIIPSSRNYGIEYNENIYIFNNLMFEENDIKELMSNFPCLYNTTIDDKSLISINKEYYNYEDEITSKKIIDEISLIIIDDYCISDKGYSKKNKFYDNNGNLDMSTAKMVSEAILLYIQGYEYNNICSYLGHSNVDKEDIKSWIKILQTSSECRDVLSDFNII